MGIDVLVDCARGVGEVIGAATGCGVSFGDGSLAMGLPQPPQNFLPDEIPFPHFAQRNAGSSGATSGDIASLSDAPHLPQNFLPSAISERQFGQIMTILHSHAKLSGKRRAAVFAKPNMNRIDCGTLGTSTRSPATRRCRRHRRWWRCPSVPLGVTSLSSKNSCVDHFNSSKRLRQVNGDVLNHAALESQPMPVQRLR